MLCTFTAATTRGQREENQDNMRVDGIAAYVDADRDRACAGSFSDSGVHVFCVCDGVGGACMGDLAAMVALYAVDGVLRHLPSGAPLRKIASAAADAAQKQVLRFYQRIRRKGGATLSLLALRQSEYCFLNIGDSPAFLYSSRERKCTELSVRHNLETRKKALGLSCEEGDSCCLTAYLGAGGRTSRAMAHIASGRLASGDAILLCTDGITNAYAEGELRAAMEQKTSAAVLASHAGSAADADNCTAIHLAFWNQEEQGRSDECDGDQAFWGGDRPL